MSTQWFLNGTKLPDISDPLRYYLSVGLTQKQIGERLGLTQQAVSWHVRRLRRMWLEEEAVILEMGEAE